MVDWIKRQGHEVKKTRSRGVWETRDGRYLIRGEATHTATGQRKEVSRLAEATDELGALLELRQALDEIRAGTTPQLSRQRFGEYAGALYERKVAVGDLKSAKTREWWGVTLEHHLVPRFGAFYLDALRRSDVEAWRAEVGLRIRSGSLSPHTANGWLSILKVVINSAFGELELPRNAIAGIAPFDTSAHRTFTEEEPNALRPDDVPRFLEAMCWCYPQHYAMTLLGFATGMRPSSLRPLRREGPSSDVKWDEGILLVRRSHAMGDEVLDRTKTAKDQRIGLPPDLVKVLEQHAARLTEKQAKSELLFPSVSGKFRARSALDKPFDDVAERIGLGYAVTPKAMRRTFQDLCRAAKVTEIVQQAVCGHAEGRMTERYSTISADEMREGISKVLDMASYRKAG